MINSVYRGREYSELNAIKLDGLKNELLVMDSFPRFITYLLVWLFGTRRHRVGLPQSGEGPGPDVWDGETGHGGDGVFGQRSVATAVRAQGSQGTGGRGVRVWPDFAQGLLRDAEEVHAEEDAPRQSREEVDDLVLGPEKLPQQRVTPVHGSHQVPKRPAETCETEEQMYKKERTRIKEPA